MTDQEIRAIFANAPDDKSTIEVIEISAPWFSKSYYLQCQDVDGLVVDGILAEYVPMTIGKSNSNEDLNDTRRITVAMVNDVIGAELAKFNPDTDPKPTITSRLYVRYRDGTISSLKGQPTVLNLNNITSDEVGTTFDISSKPTNNTYTGEVITKERFETLEGVV